MSSVLERWARDKAWACVQQGMTTPATTLPEMFNYSLMHFDSQTSIPIAGMSDLFVQVDFMDREADMHLLHLQPAAYLHKEICTTMQQVQP